jgi:hypothetical protein
MLIVLGAIRPDMPFAETLEDADKAVDEFESVQRKKLERRLGISDTVRRRQFTFWSTRVHTLFRPRTSYCLLSSDFRCRRWRRPITTSG